MTTQDTIISRHYMAQPVAAAGQAPEWIHLIPAGTFKGVDGRGPYHVADPAALIATSMANGNKLALDENHSTDTAAKAGLPAPARGWIVELQNRADGIWGRVEWTEAGRQMMAHAEYRGVSPVFVNDKGGDVRQLLRGALTNDPNLELHPLHSRTEISVNLTALRAALGLPETADEPVIIATAAAHAAQAAAATALTTELQTARAAAGSVTTMAAQIIGLETQLQTMQAATAQSAAVAFVDGQISAGKPIVALRDHYIARHVADAKSVETELNALVSINAGGMPPQRHDMGDGDALTAEEMSVCRKMGQDPKKFAATKKKMAAGKGAR